MFASTLRYNAALYLKRFDVLPKQGAPISGGTRMESVVILYYISFENDGDQRRAEVGIDVCKMSGDS